MPGWGVCEGQIFRLVRFTNLNLLDNWKGSKIHSNSIHPNLDITKLSKKVANLRMTSSDNCMFLFRNKKLWGWEGTYRFTVSLCHCFRNLRQISFSQWFSNISFKVLKVSLFHCLQIHLFDLFFCWLSWSFTWRNTKTKPRLWAYKLNQCRMDPGMTSAKFWRNQVLMVAGCWLLVVGCWLLLVAAAAPFLFQWYAL